MLSGREVRAFVDRVVSPSYVADVTEATRRLVMGRCPPGLYHCVNSGHATWLEVAEELRRLLNRPSASVVGTRAADANLRASRPLFAALSTAKLGTAGILMPDWRDALSRHFVQSADQSRPSGEVG